MSVETIKFIVREESHPWPISSLKTKTNVIPVIDMVTEGLVGGAHVSKEDGDIELLMASKNNPFALSYEIGIPFYISPIYDRNDVLVAFFLSETNGQDSYKVVKE